MPAGRPLPPAGSRPARSSYVPDASIVALRLQTPLGAGDHSASAISEGKPAKHAAIVRRRSVKRIRAASRGFVKRTSRGGSKRSRC